MSLSPSQISTTSAQSFVSESSESAPEARAADRHILRATAPIIEDLGLLAVPGLLDLPESHLNSTRSQSGSNPWAEDGWRTCSPESLRGHLVNAHMVPSILALQGVARWDIEIAAHRGIPLDWVAGKIYDRIEYSDETIRNLCYEGPASVPDFSPDEYRELLIKNLLYMEQEVGLRVDWRRVANSYSRLDEVAVQIENDSSEDSFHAYYKRLERYGTPGHAAGRMIDKYKAWE